ncbi:hypothetical protein D1007_16937 [Hordeum vulgare]|nr:hypothetical protein D1007_16937 [Hordeum vulgare]
MPVLLAHLEQDLFRTFKKFVGDTHNHGLSQIIFEYVNDLLRPFNPPPVGTPVKAKTDSQDKALIGHVLADLREVASIVREASAQQFDRMCTLEKNGRVP